MSQSSPNGTQPKPRMTTEPMLKYFVLGMPVPQGDLSASPRSGKLYHKNKALEPWRYSIAWQGRREMRRQFGDTEPVDGPISMALEFVVKRPAGTAKTRATPPAVKKPDLDKLTRAVLDALTGVVYVDDSQVVHINTTKRMAEVNEEPGVWICPKQIFTLRDWNAS